MTTKSESASAVLATIEGVHRLEDLVGADTKIRLWRRRLIVGRLQRQRTKFHRLGAKLLSLQEVQ